MTDGFDIQLMRVKWAVVALYADKSQKVLYCMHIDDAKEAMKTLNDAVSLHLIAVDSIMRCR